MLGLLFLGKTKFKNKWLLCEKQPLVFMHECNVMAI